MLYVACCGMYLKVGRTAAGWPVSRQGSTSSGSLSGKSFSWDPGRGWQYNSSGIGGLTFLSFIKRRRASVRVEYDVSLWNPTKSSALYCGAPAFTQDASRWFLCRRVCFSKGWWAKSPLPPGTRTTRTTTTIAGGTGRRPIRPPLLPSRRRHPLGWFVRARSRGNIRKRWVRPWLEPLAYR